MSLFLIQVRDRIKLPVSRSKVTVAEAAVG